MPGRGRQLDGGGRDGSPLSAMRLTELIDEVQERLGSVARAQARVQHLLDAFLSVSTGLDLPSTLRRIVESACDLVDAQYAGAKSALRPICDRLVEAAGGFGVDVEVVPKKTGVSLRRRKQFAVVEAPSATRIQLGLNLRGVAPTDRLREAGGMCTHRVDLRSLDEVDGELVAWLREAYELA